MVLGPAEALDIGRVRGVDAPNHLGGLSADVQQALLQSGLSSERVRDAAIEGVRRLLGPG